MSELSDDDVIRAWMAAHHPGVPVTDAALAATATASPPAPLTATPAQTPTPTSVPTLENGVRSASPDADADKFAQYMRQNFPGTLPRGN